MPWIACTAGGNRDSGVDQGREFANDGNRADLDDPVAMSRRKPCGFDIDDHMAVKFAHAFFRGCEI